MKPRRCSSCKSTSAYRTRSGAYSCEECGSLTDPWETEDETKEVPKSMQPPIEEFFEEIIEKISKQYPGYTRHQLTLRSVSDRGTAMEHKWDSDLDEDWKKV